MIKNKEVARAVMNHITKLARVQYANTYASVCLIKGVMEVNLSE